MKLHQVTTPMIFAILSLVFSVGFAAQTPTNNSIPGDNFETAGEFYTIKDGSRWTRTSLSPLDWLTQASRRVRDGDEFQLLDMTDHKQAPDLPTEAYNRKKHFGTWIVDSSLGGCYNTRARVLMRDSQTQVTYSSSNKCVVESGRWLDPYTGNTFTSTDDLQIDHVVPLKHAYLSGAWKWQKNKRCLYANFLADDFHLRSVSGHENMKKGDMSPSGYLPPDSRDVCGYVTDWLKIKMIWNLILVPTEIAGIQKAIQDNHCDTSELKITGADLRLIREKIAALQATCKTPKDDWGSGGDPHNED